MTKGHPYWEEIRPLTITIGEIGAMLDSLADGLERKLGGEITLDSPFYWSTELGLRFDPETPLGEVTDLESVQHERERISKFQSYDANDAAEVSPFMAEWVAGILTATANEMKNGSQQEGPLR